MATLWISGFQTVPVCDCLIIGDPDDFHASEVVRCLENLGRKPLIVNAPILQSKGFTLEGHHLRVGELELNLNSTNGWLRRFAPDNWGNQKVIGSLDAISDLSFLRLLSSISRVGVTRWLTAIDDLFKAEDRLLQLETAQRIGIPVPKTIVTSDGRNASKNLGPRFVLKPLAFNYFETPSELRLVFTNEFSVDELDNVDFASAPFVAQEHLKAIEHLRIVTVQDNAWVASISALGRPLDWREQEEAHTSWEPVKRPEVTELALKLSSAAKIGYSSQDWIVDEFGAKFIDLNPGGQWLFLPEPMSSEITNAIVQFLNAER